MSSMPEAGEETIHKVVAGYYEAFVRDSGLAATFYGEPTLIVLQNDVRCLPTRKDVQRFLADGLQNLRSLGYSNTRMTASHAKRLTASNALYTTVAVRMRADGTELQRAAFTYVLHRGSGGWKIHALIAGEVASSSGLE